MFLMIKKCPELLNIALFLVNYSNKENQHLLKKIEFPIKLLRSYLTHVIIAKILYNAVYVYQLSYVMTLVVKGII